MNTVEKVNLSGLRACDQQWEKMTPSERGRICGKCDKQIIDFRNFTPLEIAREHALSNLPVCGLYTEEQLAPTKRMTFKKKSTWSSVYLGILGLFYVNNLSGQETGDSTTIVQTEKDYEKRNTDVIQKSNSPAVQAADSIIISGRLTDTNDEPLIHGTVLVKDFNKGTSTDFEGFYHIDLTEFFQDTSEITLVFSYIGFQTTEVLLRRDEVKVEGTNEFNMALTAAEMELIAFGITIKPPLHKRIWRGIKRFFTRKD